MTHDPFRKWAESNVAPNTQGAPPPKLPQLEEPAPSDPVPASMAKLPAEEAGPRFKAGDVVVLKSGGPAMTVVGIVLHRPPVIYHTKWFDGSVVVEGNFSEPEIMVTVLK